MGRRLETISVLLDVLSAVFNLGQAVRSETGVSGRYFLVGLFAGLTYGYLDRVRIGKG